MLIEYNVSNYLHLCFHSDFFYCNFQNFARRVRKVMMRRTHKIPSNTSQRTANQLYTQNCEHTPRQHVYCTVSTTVLAPNATHRELRGLKVFNLSVLSSIPGIVPYHPHHNDSIAVGKFNQFDDLCNLFKATIIYLQCHTMNIKAHRKPNKSNSCHREIEENH